jgi:putative membrane protein insertion efficiency factor
MRWGIVVLLAIFCVLFAVALSGAGEIEKKEEKTFPDRLFRFYKEHISSKDGPRCPFYPTCSRFGLKAVKKHGFIKGLFMTTDRLMREYPGMHKADNYPVIRKYGVDRLHDPVP